MEKLKVWRNILELNTALANNYRGSMHIFCIPSISRIWGSMDDIESLEESVYTHAKKSGNYYDWWFTRDREQGKQKKEERGCMKTF